jgi:L-asparaginase
VLYYPQPIDRHLSLCRLAARLILAPKVTKTDVYMRTPRNSSSVALEKGLARLPSSLDVSTYAVTLLENNPLFNSAHGAVFTRDGINELEASVMVSRGRAKRGVGVSGLRRVKNPILLAKAMLEHGDADLAAGLPGIMPAGSGLNVPSAQGHTLVFGQTAEQLAEGYGLDLVDPKYFFVQKRWNQHIQGLERERRSGGLKSASWCPEEYIPQGTCGAVSLDEEGVICVATSTGGITNKLTGRIGDTPVVGAGFWAEEWEEEMWAANCSRTVGPAVELCDALKGWLADCLPTPWTYQPVSSSRSTKPVNSMGPRAMDELTATRSMAVSGTGNGDSFMRLDACRTVGAKARYGRQLTSYAIRSIAGQDGALQESAGDRWNVTGEGEGGMIGIDCTVLRDEDGNVVGADSEIIQAHNCGGLFRAWIDDEGETVVKIFEPDDE